MVWPALTPGMEGNDQKKSAETVFNSNAILKHIDPIFFKAKRLYEQKAYLHWYERYAKRDVEGLFDEAFEEMSQVQDNYLSLGLL